MNDFKNKQEKLDEQQQQQQQQQGVRTELILYQFSYIEFVHRWIYKVVHSLANQISMHCCSGQKKIVKFLSGLVLPIF